MQAHMRQQQQLAARLLQGQQAWAMAGQQQGMLVPMGQGQQQQQQLGRTAPMGLVPQQLPGFMLPAYALPPQQQ